MTKTKPFLGIVIALAIASLLITPSAYAEPFNPIDQKAPHKNIWNVIYDIESALGLIQEKLTPTVNIEGQTTATLPSTTEGSPTNPHHVIHKHLLVKPTVFTPSDPNVYYTSLAVDGDVPMIPVQLNIPPECTSFNAGTVANPDEEVLGWCPESGQYWYFIQDSTVSANSLISMNIQAPPVSASQSEVNPPECSATETGNFQFATQNMTGFILQCDNYAQPSANEPLVYIVLN